ncbi:MAG: MFS transporter [Chloroflexi bacterium]|nr:MFS transporter [Chloroflexota bacterium]
MNGSPATPPDQDRTSKQAAIAQPPHDGLPLQGWRRTFSSLYGNRDFTFLFAGNVGFFFGMQMMMILSGWLIIHEWDNAAYLGYMLATAAIPMLVLAPIGGVVSDRVDKRRLLLVTQSLLVVTSGLVTVLILSGRIQFWHLLLITPVSGAAFSFNIPGRQALVAILVPRDHLMNAISLSSAAMNASRIVAPALAGLLVVPIGIGGAYVVATVCYASAAVATAFLPSSMPRRVKQFTFLEDFTGGFGYIRGSTLLMGLLLFATVPMLFAMPYQTLLPVFANDVWHVGSAGFGMMQAASGFGGFAGGIVAANLDAYRRKGTLMVVAAVGFGALLFVLALSPWFAVALVLMAALGFASMTFTTVNNTAIQMVIPDEYRGRVMSVMMMTFGLMPLGAVPAGIAAQSIGAPPVVAASAVLFILTTLGIFVAAPSLRTLDRGMDEGRARETARRAAALSPPAVPAPAPSTARTPGTSITERL